MAMNCKEVEDKEILEEYLLGRLEDSERDAFEAHYFECDSCFSRVQNGLAMLEGLRSQRPSPERAGAVFSRRIWAWTPALAAVIMLLAVGIWWRSAQQKSLDRVVGSHPSPPEVSQPSTRPASSLDELAKVEPPPYTPVVLRGAEDESNQNFRRSMEYYLKSDYADAIPGLHALAQTSPESSKFNFYLGACYLLTNRTDLAIEALRKTTAIGDTAYSEQAHFYLAKAYLKKRQLPEAKAELQQTVKLSGDRKIEAEEILRQLPE